MFNIVKYREIKEKLEKKAKNCQIIAISKNHPRQSVLEALNQGVRIFGENRVMEAKSKFLGLKDQFANIELHLTGPLQSNKVKEAVNIFDVFHTLDREKIAREFSKYTETLITKKIFIQVNTGEEISKSGISPKDLRSFLEYCKNDMKLNICGLMCIPPIDDNPDDHFSLLKNLVEKNNLTNLSIGMSGDYESAIKFNPSYIRLGTILFGKRA